MRNYDDARMKTTEKNEKKRKKKKREKDAKNITVKDVYRCVCCSSRLKCKRLMGCSFYETRDQKNTVDDNKLYKGVDFTKEVLTSNPLVD